jgi:hypothetical protein
MSVITAASAASLAIPGLAGPGTYWMISACFCIAFGLSLEGLMLVTYISIVAGGAPDEIIGLLATGEAYIYAWAFRIISPKTFAALVLALPATFSTYSSMFLLLGAFLMVTQGPVGATFESHERAFSVLALVPLSIGLTVIIVVFVICEAVLWRHGRDRKGVLKGRNGIA